MSHVSCKTFFIRISSHLYLSNPINVLQKVLRIVRSMEELKEELRSLTVRVEGRQETISELLKNRR